MDITTRYTLLRTLRSTDQTAYGAGSKRLALELLGKHHLAHRLDHVHVLLTEAERRLKAAKSAIQIPEGTSVVQALFEHDGPEVARERKYYDDYKSRWQEIEQEVRAVADDLEAGIDREDPNYIARRQESDLP